MTKILELLEPAATGFQLKAETSTEVIVYLGKLLVKAGYVRDSFIDAAVSREKELPTGLPLNGNTNAAIPHTDVEHVIKAGLAMATLAQPVVFRNMAAPDETIPVQLVFLLALDKPKAQIEMLQEIAGLLQQPDRVTRLTEVNNFEEVKNLLAAA